MKKYGLGMILLFFAAVSLGSAEVWKIKLEEAKVHLDQKELGQADAILTDLAKDHSDQWEVEYYLGLTKLAKGENEAAEKALSQASALAPTDLSIRVDHAFALLNLNRPEEARKELNLVLSKDQKNGRAFYLRGISFILKNDCKSAEPDLAKAKQLDKNYTGMAEYYLGQCALNEGKGVEARKHFDHAIETSPGTEWANRATEAAARLPKRGAFFAGGDFFYQYDTNIVPVSSEEALPEEVSHQEDSRGVVYVQAGYRPLIRDAGELALEYHFYNSWHFEESDLNLQIHQGAVNGYYNLDVLGKPARIWAQYMYQYAGLGDSYHYYSTNHRITPVFFVAESDKLFTEIDYQYENESFDEPGEGDMNRDNQSHQIMAGQHFYLLEGKVDLSVFARYRAVIAEGKDYDQNRYGGRAMGQLLGWNKISGFAYFDFDYRDYYRSAFDRLDRVYAAGMEVQYELINHLALFGGVSYSDYESNIENFDYDRWIYTAGVRATY